MEIVFIELKNRHKKTDEIETQASGLAHILEDKWQVNLTCPNGLRNTTKTSQSG